MNMGKYYRCEAARWKQFMYPVRTLENCAGELRQINIYIHDDSKNDKPIRVLFKGECCAKHIPTYDVILHLDFVNEG